MRYYVMGDVHGYYTAMMEALHQAGYAEDTGPHTIVLVGDLFDRGREARQVQKQVLDWLAQDAVILIRGNHEDLLVQMTDYDGARAHPVHIHNGTYQTALDLTGYMLDIALEQNYAFAKAIRQTPLYREILPAMKDYWETTHYVFTHGYIPCIQAGGRYFYREDWRQADKRAWEEARWYNGMELCRQAPCPKTVVCGHWHASFGHCHYEGKGSEFGDDADFTTFYGDGVIGVDACTAWSGFVNCAVLEDEPLPGQSA